MICGIYQIKNKINNKSYVGQSVDIKKRWREHIFSSSHKDNKDYNSPIHLAISKYGKENFDFSILEECDKMDLNNKEIYWIEKLNTFKNGYNATIGGFQDHRHIGQPVEIYDLNGKYLTTYDNITIAAENIGVSRNTIYGIIYGDRLSAKGYQFKLVNDKNKKITKYTNKQGGKIPVLMLDDDYNIIKKFESAAAAGREMSLDSSCIIKCCKGKLQHHGGWRWQYEN